MHKMTAIKVETKLTKFINNEHLILVIFFIQESFSL
jgi:hypothetical protein